MGTAARRIDTTVYPETDHMGEGELQRLITEVLRPLLARFLAELGAVAHVGANQFIYYEQFNSAKRTAPDVYVFRDVPQSRVMSSWKLWELGDVPASVIEVVSRAVGKDYDDVPAIHAEIGTRELIVFDPEASGRKGRHTWRVHHRGKKGFALTLATNADRVHAKELGCWLRVIGRGDERRVRVATGKSGQHLFATDEERALQERLEKEQERSEKERERSEKEQERASRISLQKEVADLRAQIEKLRKR